MIATKSSDRISREELLERNRQRDIGINLSDEIHSMMDEPETDDVPVLTDDRAPVERLLDPLIGTEYVIEQ
jgi:hypothetical protein